ncbi:hypothetical protein BV911_04670 [Pseudoruegeria sp. SK021]|nr:hypothetical protein BV911_04670 [Pseudoruegeria sp. SK021]
MKHELYLSSDDAIDLTIVSMGTLPDAPLPMPKQVIESDLRGTVFRRIAHLFGPKQVSAGH